MLPSGPMTFAQAVTDRTRALQTRLCVGLDPRLDAYRDAAHLREHTLDVLEAVAPYAACVKPQLAFYEAAFKAKTGRSARGVALDVLVDKRVPEVQRIETKRTARDRDAYCDESAYVAIQLGAIPRDVPRDAQRARQAFEATLASGEVIVNDTARALADAVLAPPLTRIIAAGTLPATVREQYRFAWDDRKERQLQRAERWLRRLRGAAPDVIALWPPARHG